MVEGQALGVMVECDLELRHLSPVTAASADRRLTVRLHRGADEAGGLVVELDGDTHVIAASGHGTHRLGPGGRRDTSIYPRDPDAAWYRLFFAQVLPISAALQGLEPLHASAVTLDGQAVGIVADSGTGKSTVMAHLLAGGAGFLTDDVLAVGLTDGGAPEAHSGPAYMRLAPKVLAELPAGGPSAVTNSTHDDKVLLAPVPEADVAPLRAVWILERGPGRKIEIDDLAGHAPTLLTSTFVPHVTTAERLITQMDVAASISRHVQCRRLRIPPGVGAAETAAVIAAGN